MPALSPTMTMGNIGTWQKQAGDKVDPGDVLVEIETDKAQMDFEYQDEGYLAKVMIADGAKEVKVGTPIAVMVDEVESVSAFSDFSVDITSTAEETKTETPTQKNEGSSTKTPDISDKKSGLKDSATPSRSGNRIAATPSARWLANDRGISLSKVTGTGPGGRIVESDVSKFKEPDNSSISKGSPSSRLFDYEDTPITNMRSVIASRLQESKSTAPHYYITSKLNMNKLLKLRVALNDMSTLRISINDLFIKAVAQACKKVPQVNSSWMDDEKIIRQYKQVDVSVAVATPSGLVTPIVFNADSIGITDISKKMKDLGQKAKENKLKPEEYQGGTVTISNLGMNDAVESFTAIINPPQSCILAIGATSDVGESKVCQVTGSFDHRVIDGATGAAWLKELKQIVENPIALIL